MSNAKLRSVSLLTLAAGAAFIVAVHQRTATASQTHADVIRITGIREPQELLVEPFPKSIVTPPERMLGEALSNSPSDRGEEALTAALDRTLQEYPSFSDGYLMRAGILCEQNAPNELRSAIDSALKYADRLTDKQKSQASLFAMRAKLELLDGKTDRALQTLNEVLFLPPDDIMSFANSGGITPEDATKYCSWSRADLRKLTDSFPNDYSPFLFTGVYYGSFAKFDQSWLKPALDNLAKAASLNPRLPVLPFLQAEVLRQAYGFKQMNFSESERATFENRVQTHLNAALDLDPSYEPALVERAYAETQLKSWKAAIEDYDRALVIKPNDSGLLDDRGVAKLDSGDARGAIDDLTGSLKFRERKAQESFVYEARADAYLKSEQYELAIHDLSAAISSQLAGLVNLMNMEQFRALYPEYKTISDEVLTKKLGDTFQPDVPSHEFARRFLYQNTNKEFFNTPTLWDLYDKRMGVFTKQGNWELAANDYRRITNGFHINWKPDRWREIRTGDSGYLYLDLQTFSAQNSRLRIWTKQSPTADGEVGPYKLEQLEVNCKERQYRTLSSAEHDFYGNETKNSGASRWQGPQPDSNQEFVVDRACKIS